MSQPAESAQMFTILDHPLVGMKMTTLRDQRTPPQQFRRTLHEIAGLMSFHVFAHLRCDARDVHTPLETTTGQ
ncbi:MAG: uracil phosphoribosyltransferase, partial [Candidatus Puniceispirillaceae bacterium]